MKNKVLIFEENEFDFLDICEMLEKSDFSVDSSFEKLKEIRANYGITPNFTNYFLDEINKEKSDLVGIVCDEISAKMAYDIIQQEKNKNVELKKFYSRIPFVCVSEKEYYKIKSDKTGVIYIHYNNLSNIGHILKEEIQKSQE